MAERKIKKVIWHCSYTPAEMDIGVREIRDWHTKPKPEGNGWKDVAYHYIIRRDGTLETGRPEGVAGAHCYGHNKDSIGICLVGGMGPENTPLYNFTQAQMTRARTLLRSLQARYPDATHHGHNEFSDKPCPTFDVPAWVKDVA